MEGEIWLELKQLNSEPAQWQGAELTQEGVASGGFLAHNRDVDFWR
jgi:hypothetical protein